MKDPQEIRLASGPTQGLDVKKFARDIAATQQPIQKARHLPGYFYSSPEIFAAEKKEIFMKDWLCIARIEELPEPGDYLTLRIVDEPVIVARNRAGELHAFGNVCAHRGVEIARDRGNVARFSCPYHGWSYDLDGRLTGASFMAEAEGFNPKDYRLPPIRLEVWAGWIFVCFDKATESLDEFMAEVNSEFGYVKDGKLKMGVKFEVTLDCNWKLMVENFIDIYHVKVLHAKSFGKHAKNVDSYPFRLKRRGGFSSFHESAPITPEGKGLFGKRKVMQDKSDNFAASCHLAPNFHMFQRSDTVHHLRAWPIDVNTSKFVAYVLFPEEFFGDPAFAAKAEVYREFFHRSLVEDEAMVRSLQRAMSSEQFQPGRFSRLEASVHNCITYYTERMFGRVDATANEERKALAT